MSNNNENLNKIRFVDFSLFNISQNNELSDSSESEIALPIVQESVISEIKNNDGIVGGMSVLLEDSEENHFTLYVSTLKNYMKYLKEIDENLVIAGDEEESATEEEPVMLLPFNELDREKVFNLIRNLNTDYLKLFAVKQIEDIDSEI
jgi:hypothetical protein